MNCENKPPCENLVYVRGTIENSYGKDLDIPEQLHIITTCANQQCPFFDLDKLRATKISNTANLYEKLNRDLNDFLKACDCVHL